MVASAAKKRGSRAGIAGIFGDLKQAVRFLNSGRFSRFDLLMFAPDLTLPEWVLEEPRPGTEPAIQMRRLPPEGITTAPFSLQPGARKMARGALEAKAQESLRGYVDSWLGVDRDTSRWASRYPSRLNCLNRQLLRYAFRPQLTGSAKVERLNSGKSKHRLPEPDYSKAPVALQISATAATAPRAGDTNSEPLAVCWVSLTWESQQDVIEAFAAFYFVPMILSPDGTRVGKCSNCGHYFLSEERRTKKRCCSPRCKWGRQQKRRYEAARGSKLKIAARLRTEAFGQRVEDWKSYVLQRAPRDSGITRNFLTHADNRGDFSLRGDGNV